MAAAILTEAILLNKRPHGAEATAEILYMQADHLVMPDDDSPF